jgi:beta-lactamase class A
MKKQTHPTARRWQPMTAWVALGLWFQTHPRTLRHLLHAGVVVAVLFTALNIGLFSAQNGRTAALTTINGKAYGLMPIERAKQILQTDHAAAQLVVKTGDKTVVFDAEDVGVTVNADATFDKFIHKRGWQRVPLVDAIGNLFATLKPAYNIDRDMLLKSLAPYISEKVIPAQDATVAIPTDEAQPATIALGVNGYELTAAEATDELTVAIKNGDFASTITGRTVEPKWSVLELRAFLPVIEAARHTTLTVAAGEHKLEISGAALAPMLRLDTASSELKMTLDTTSLRAYLDQQAPIFYTAPVATKVTLKDGTEVARQDGTPGTQIDSTATAALAVKAFESGLKSITPSFASVTPEVLVTRTYSNTSAGLLKIIEDFVSGHAGAYRVAAVELAGPDHRSAFYNADVKTIPASTYKLYLAYSIMQRIEAGTLSLETPTARGSIDDCMHEMIIVSPNECANIFHDMLGWAALDAKLVADGFTSTKLDNSAGGDKYTTANDQINLLSKLYFTDLINQNSQDYLFGLMKRQIWRSGIPAGSRGATVADKVGYLDNLTHDIAIVYGPKATYALVILTDGAGGWPNIRALAQQVYDFYNQ